MKPIKNCPLCAVAIRWILYDGANTYDCSNKNCPIRFNEAISFRKDETDFDLNNGLWLNYHAYVDDFHLVGDCSNNRLCLYLNGTLATIVKGVLIPDFSDLEQLKKKIRIWILFS